MNGNIEKLDSYSEKDFKILLHGILQELEKTGMVKDVINMHDHAQRSRQTEKGLDFLFFVDDDLFRVERCYGVQLKVVNISTSVARSIAVDIDLALDATHDLISVGRPDGKIHGVYLITTKDFLNGSKEIIESNIRKRITNLFLIGGDKLKVILSKMYEKIESSKGNQIANPIAINKQGNNEEASEN